MDTDHPSNDQIVPVYTESVLSVTSSCRVVQLVAHQILDLGVLGSSPSAAAFPHFRTGKALFDAISHEPAFDEVGLVLDLLQAVPDDLDQVAEAGDGEVGHGPLEQRPDAPPDSGQARMRAAGIPVARPAHR